MVQVGAEPGKRTPTEGSSWMWGLPLIIGRSQSIWTPTLIECSGESISDFMGGYLKVTRVAIILYLRPREGENSVTWVPHVGLTTGGITELIMPNYFSKSNKTWGLTTDFSGGFNLVQIFQIVSIYPWSNLAQDNYNIVQPCFWANYKRAIPKSDINPWWGAVSRSIMMRSTRALSHWAFAPFESLPTPGNPRRAGQRDRPCCSLSNCATTEWSMLDINDIHAIPGYHYYGSQ